MEANIMEASIEIGKKAPAFTLLDQDEVKHALKDYLGQWVVLYFYPKDDTPGCTTEACEFTTELPALQKLNATVLGCSADDAEKHQKFRAKYKLKITLLSDPEHTVMAKYGAWGEKTLYGKKSIGVIRSTVIIDPAGKIAHHWKSVKSAGHAAKVKERLQALQTKA